MLKVDLQPKKPLQTMTIDLSISHLNKDMIIHFKSEMWDSCCSILCMVNLWSDMKLISTYHVGTTFRVWRWYDYFDTWWLQEVLETDVLLLTTLHFSLTKTSGISLQNSLYAQAQIRCLEIWNSSVLTSLALRSELIRLF